MAPAELMSTPWEKCWEGHGRIQVHTHANTQARKLKKYLEALYVTLGGWPKLSSFSLIPMSQCTAVSQEALVNHCYGIAGYKSILSLRLSSLTQLVHPTLNITMFMHILYSHLWLWRIVRKKSLKASQVSRNQFAIFPRNVFANSQRYTPIPW